MRSVQKVLLVLAVILSMGLGALVMGEKAPENKIEIKVQKLEEQVVLYTIYRGDYAQVGQAIGQLYGRAGQKGIRPRGSAYLVFLNNPKLVSSAHWLTEVRIRFGWPGWRTSSV